MSQQLYCPYCGDGPKNIEGPGCCGESPAHFEERCELLETLRGLIQATTMPGPVLHQKLKEAQELVQQFDGKKQ